MISLLVGSGRPDKCSFEIPNECLSGWGNLSREVVSIKRNHLFNLGFFFFKWRFGFSHMLRLSGQLHFRTNYFFIRLPCNYFDTTVVFFGVAIHGIIGVHRSPLIPKHHVPFNLSGRTFSYFGPPYQYTCRTL